MLLYFLISQFNLLNYNVMFGLFCLTLFSVEKKKTNKNITVRITIGHTV